MKLAVTAKQRDFLRWLAIQIRTDVRTGELRTAADVATWFENEGKEEEKDAAKPK